MKKIIKIMSFVASLTLFSQSLTGAMQPSHDDFKMMSEGFFAAKNIYSIRNKTQLENKINDFVINIKNNRVSNDIKIKIVEYICAPNHPFMRFCVMSLGINSDETRRNILRILNDHRNGEVNMSLAEIVKNNKVEHLQMLATFFSTIYNTINF